MLVKYAYSTSIARYLGKVVARESGNNQSIEAMQ